MISTYFLPIVSIGLDVNTKSKAIVSFNFQKAIYKFGEGPYILSINFGYRL